MQYTVRTYHTRGTFDANAAGALLEVAKRQAIKRPYVLLVDVRRALKPVRYSQSSILPSEDWIHRVHSLSCS